MGDIAAPAATDQHLVQRLGSGLQQGDVTDARLSGSDGRHESGGATAGHDHGGMTRERHGTTGQGTRVGSMG